MKKLKIGIVGVGGISNVHIAGYLARPDVELYAFCDINEERLKEKGAKYGITRLFTDVNEMVKLPELDAVSVCTWNNAHAPCTIAALNAGKHVLCEKPMAMTVAEAEQMQAAAEKSGKLLMIGFVRRFGNDCAILKDFIGKDKLGVIYYSKATYLRRHGNPGGWFSNKKLSGGGPLIDLGVHVIDLVRYLIGNPKPISVYGATFNKLGNRQDIKSFSGYASESRTNHDSCNVEDLAVATIRFENGAVLSIEASFELNMKKPIERIELFGTKAGAAITPNIEIFGTENGYMTNIEFASNTSLDFNNLFENEISHFIDCITLGTECRAPAKDGIEVMKILEAAYKSAELGHEVVLNQ